MTISMDKKYRTRDGREVRIYAVDGGYGKHPIHGAVNSDYGWIVQMWSDIGACASGSTYDLIEVKPRIQREYWVNMYPIHSINPVLWESLDDAKKSVPYGFEPIARVKVVIDCEEGDGL